jgi:hypothetical protein
MHCFYCQWLPTISFDGYIRTWFTNFCKFPNLLLSQALIIIVKVSCTYIFKFLCDNIIGVNSLKWNDEMTGLKDLKSVWYKVLFKTLYICESVHGPKVIQPIFLYFHHCDIIILLVYKVKNNITSFLISLPYEMVRYSPICCLVTVDKLNVTWCLLLSTGSLKGCLTLTGWNPVLPL